MSDRVSQGDYGTTIEYTVTDENGTPRDFTGITLSTSEMKLANPQGSVTTLPATFKNPPGADGVFTAQVDQPNAFTPSGQWSVHVLYEGSGFKYSSVPQSLTVTTIPGET